METSRRTRGAEPRPPSSPLRSLKIDAIERSRNEYRKVPLPLVYKDVLEVHLPPLLHHHFHHSLTLRLHQRSSLQHAFPNHPRTACHGHLCSSRSHHGRSQVVLPFQYDLHQLTPCCADTCPPQHSQLSRREAEPGRVINTEDVSVRTLVLSGWLV